MVSLDESDVEYVEYYSTITTWFKSIIVACAMLHFYYTVTHLDDEVEYIWSRKWTGGKIMYLLTRYLGTIFLICSVIGVNTYTWYDTGFRTNVLSGVDSYVPRTVKNFIPTWLYGELFAELGPMIILTAEIILQMRVYALYGMDKRLLAFFILLTISLFGFNILQMTDPFFNVEVGNCRVDDECFSGTPGEMVFIQNDELDRYECLEANSISGIGWSVISFTELLLFLLVIIRAWKRLFQRGEQAMTHDICASMAKDSLSYFAVLFSVCLFGAILNFAPENGLGGTFANATFYEKNSYETIVITVMTILAPRLIINLREEVYGPPEITESQLTWNADVSRQIASGGGVVDSTDADAGGNGSSDPERS